MNRKIGFALIFMAGCGGHGDHSNAASDTIAYDTVSTPVAKGEGALIGEGGMAGRTRFDPEQVKAGDTIASLTVARVRRPPDDYIVSFSGEVEVNGQYRPHFDYPEVKLPCFWVDPDSWVKLPRAQTDTRVIWFCFDNDAHAIRELGPLGTQARATIMIDNYQTMLNQSDVIDRATLIRVLRKEPIQ